MLRTSSVLDARPRRPASCGRRGSVPAAVHCPTGPGVRMIEPRPPVSELDDLLLRHAVDEMADRALVVLDRSYCVRFWTKAAETTFGRAAGDVLGRTLDRVFGDATGCWDLLNEARTAAGAVSIRCWFTLPDGSQRCLDATATRLHDDSTCIGFALHAQPAAAPGIPAAASSGAAAAGRERDRASSVPRGAVPARLEAGTTGQADVDRLRIRQLRRLVVAEEAERTRIARDLREHLGQQLTAL